MEKKVTFTLFAALMMMPIAFGQYAYQTDVQENLWGAASQNQYESRDAVARNSWWYNSPDRENAWIRDDWRQGWASQRQSVPDWARSWDNTNQNSRVNGGQVYMDREVYNSNAYYQTPSRTVYQSSPPTRNTYSNPNRWLLNVQGAPASSTNSWSNVWSGRVEVLDRNSDWSQNRQDADFTASYNDRWGNAYDAIGKYNDGWLVYVKPT